jgi:glycosyltransferase involved in cell wall biosynthesis
MPDQNISLIIKTFERQSALERLLASIRAHGYTKYPVLVADDSKTPYKDAILQEYGDVVDQYIILPFDSGLSKGRNELLKRVETEYFVLNDDDFVYSEDTDLAGARDTLERHDLDILGGYLYWPSKRYRFAMLPERLSDMLGLYEESWAASSWVAEIQETEDGGISVQGVPDVNRSLQRCDLCMNFFIGRTEPIWDRVGGWNPDLKSGSEHWEFFYRCKKAELQVACSDVLLAYHVHDSNPAYEGFRYDREDEMVMKSLQAHGFRYLKRGGSTHYDNSYSEEKNSSANTTQSII